MSDAKREPQGPPKDVTPSELWLAMLTLPVPHEKADMPIKEPVYGKTIGQVAIVPLSPEELMISRRVAAEWATKMTGESPKSGEESPAYLSIASDETLIQVLWRALRDVNDPTLKTPAIPAAMLMRKPPFTADILAVLGRMYTRTCMVCGPIVATMGIEEMNAWLDALEEGGAGFPFDTLSSGMLSDLLKHSIARYRSSKTGNGLPGQPPDEALGNSIETSRNDPPPQMPEPEQPPDVSADDLVIPKS